VVAVVAAFAVIFVLSRHTVNSGSITTTSGSGAAAVTTTSSVATTGTTSSTTPTAVDTTCVGGDFSATYQVGFGAAGTGYSSIVLTKKSSGSCVVIGHPILTLQDKFGAVLHVVQVNLPRASASYIQYPDAAANESPVAHTVSLGQSVNIDLATSDVQVANTACESIASLSLQLSPGGTAIIVSPSYPITACDGGKVWVSPYF
jgi:hypothetical protein